MTKGSDEGLTLETTASESFYGGQLTLSTHFIHTINTVDKIHIINPVDKIHIISPVDKIHIFNPVDKTKLSWNLLFD